MDAVFALMKSRSCTAASGVRPDCWIAAVNKRPPANFDDTSLARRTVLPVCIKKLRSVTYETCPTLAVPHEAVSSPASNASAKPLARSEKSRRCLANEDSISDVDGSIRRAVSGAIRAASERSVSSIPLGNPKINPPCNLDTSISKARCWGSNGSEIVLWASCLSKAWACANTLVPTDQTSTTSISSKGPDINRAYSSIVRTRRGC